MRRLGPIVCVLATLALAAPASGAPAPYSGSVAVATVTSAVPYNLYKLTHTNDRVTGDVFRLPASADGAVYALTLTSGATGLENPDVYFYMAGGDDAPGRVCELDAHDQGPSKETGTICGRAAETVAWAIVVLRAGAGATFDFSYQEA